MDRLLQPWVRAAGVICAVAVFVSVGQTIAVAEPASKTPAERPQICALIADAAGGLDKSPLFLLLEIRLSKHKGLRLVDRMEIKRVLEELKLKLMFGAAGGPERRRVGKILKADLLVALRAGQVKKVRYVDVVVCETAGGLRLLTRSVVLSDKPQDGAARIEGLINKALRKYAEGVAEICAVPPFLSGDLTHRYDHLQTAYARLIEQMLLKNKGMLVVELAEARAVAREVLLSGQAEGPKRKLPLYIFGEYRHSGNGKDRKVAVNLTIKRGQKVLGSVKKGELVTAAVPAFLRESTQRLVAKATGREMPAPDPAAEARLLAERAYTFQRIGNWKEALALYEASLLLDPDRETVRRGIVLTLEQLTRSCYEMTSRGMEFTVTKATRGLNYYRLGLLHVEWLMRFGKSCQSDRENDRIWYWFFSNFFSSALWFERSGVEQIQTLYDRIVIEQQEMLFRVLEYRMQKGNLIWPIVGPASRHTFHRKSLYSDQKQYEQCKALWLRALRIIATHPKARIWADSFLPLPPYVREREIGHRRYKALLEEMSRIPSKGIQQAANDLRKRYEAQLAKGRLPHKGYITDREGDDRGEANIIIRRLSFAFTDESGERRLGDARLTGWRPCGKGLDAAWSRTEMFLMKEPGKLKRVFAAKEDKKYFRFAGVTYDGKYIWAPVIRGSYWDIRDGLLLVIDPKSEKVWKFTAKDGLPSMSRGAAAAALEPGKICLAGAFERGWVAIVKFDPARGKSIKIIHEARIQPDKSKDRYAQAHDPDIAFSPKFMFALSRRPGRRDPPRVLLGRGFSGLGGVVPCLIDLERKSLTVTPEKGIYTGCFPPLDLALHDGAIHWIRGTFEKTVKGGKKYIQWHVDVHRMRLTGMKKETVLKRFTPVGEWRRPQIFFFDGRIHIVGSQWWSSEDFSKPFVRMRTKFVGCRKPSHSDVPGGAHPYRKFWSGWHYGLLLVVPGAGVFQADFQNRLKPPAANRPAATEQPPPADRK